MNKRIKAFNKLIIVSTFGIVGPALPFFAISMLGNSAREISGEIEVNPNKGTKISTTTLIADGTLAGLKTTNPTVPMLYEWIFSKRNDIFTNLPKEFSMSNLALSNFSRQSNDGTITFDICIGYFYNDDGTPNDYGTRLWLRGFKITGFVPSNSETSINPNPKITNELASLCPYQILPDEDFIRQYTINNILVNPPLGMESKDIIEIKFSKIDNLTGTIVISKIVVNKRCDKNGTVIRGVYPYNEKITILGLRSVQPTAFLPEINYNELQLPSQDNLFDASKNLQSFITGNIISILAPKAEAPANIKVEIFLRPVVMKNYRLKLDFYVSDYFNANGDYVKYKKDGENQLFSVIIKNFPYTDDSFNAKSFFTDNNYFWTIFIAVGGAIIIGLLTTCIVLACKGRKRIVYEGINSITSSRRFGTAPALGQSKNSKLPPISNNDTKL